MPLEDGKQEKLIMGKKMIISDLGKKTLEAERESLKEEMQQKW